MKAAFVVLAIAAAVPSAYSIFFGTGTGLGLALPTISLGTTTTTTGTATAATTLGAAGAAAAGFGALAAVVAGSGAAGFLAGRAVGNAIRGGNRGGNRRRGRRSTEEEEFAISAALGEELIFSSLVEMDNMNCGKKYICELAATPLDQLTSEEFAALAIFTTPRGQPGSARSLFDAAVLLGANTRSYDACAKKYQSCQSEEAVPKIFRNLSQSS